MNKNFIGVILAAGEGTRMKSSTPKVMHLLCGIPMLAHVLNLAKSLRLKNTIVIVGNKNVIPDVLLKEYNARSVRQDRPLGTADALKRTQGCLKDFRGHIVVFYGDQPLLKGETLSELMRRHAGTGSDVTILTAKVDDPGGYGRVVRDNFARITSIVEEKDANPLEKAIKEINTGIICFKKDVIFRILGKVKPNNAKKEYYLTDAIRIMSNEGLTIESLCIFDDVWQAKGVNSRQDLAAAQKMMYRRISAEFMDRGVSVADPENTYIDSGCEIGQDTVIYPFTVIEKGVKIGKLCTIGPFCHLRPGTIIEDNVVMGNFTESVRSRIGKATLMKHFSYVGDAYIGHGVNIGAGTVVANFDGKDKQKTVIGNGAFIGSDTVLRAPVRIGQGAVTGAGSVVTKDVMPRRVVAGVPARELVKKIKNKDLSKRASGRKT